MRELLPGLFHWTVFHEPIGATVRALESGGYTGWYVLEQDTSVASEDPAAGEGPAEDVRRSLDYVLTLLGE